MVDRLLIALLSTQLFGAVVIVALGPFSAVGRYAVLIVLVAMTAVRWRRHAGGDGAEQMSSLVLMAAALAVFPVSSPSRVTMAVIFIAAQLVLSYVAAGIAKLASPTWRVGDALPAIFGTEIHGDPQIAAFLGRRRRLARLISWSVMAFECAFPLLLLGPAGSC